MSKLRNKPRNHDSKLTGLYDSEETQGRGHFAGDGEKVAVKVIDKTKLDDISRAHLFQEVRCMKLVQHPNVVRLYEVIDTQTKLYLILELGDGCDMYDYIMKHEKGLDEETARKYFRQIVHAISYCHKLHVVHRDLKPENVVFFEKLDVVKLTDFGFSNKFCPGQKNWNWTDKLETCGSLPYSAPEILLGGSDDAPSVDIWGLGVILYMLVCGHAPFQEANDSETMAMIMECKYTVPPHISNDCRRLIQKMLVRDPQKRASLEQIANDVWLCDKSSPVHPAADYLPLMSCEHLSEDDRRHIIQKLANGGVATEGEIVEALDKNAYNHITATYFLLAERMLRAQHGERGSGSVLNHGTRCAKPELPGLAIAARVPPTNPSISPTKTSTVMESLLSPRDDDDDELFSECLQNVSDDILDELSRLALCNEENGDEEDEGCVAEGGEEDEGVVSDSWGTLRQIDRFQVRQLVVEDNNRVNLDITVSSETEEETKPADDEAAAANTSAEESTLSSSHNQSSNGLLQVGMKKRFLESPDEEEEEEQRPPRIERSSSLKTTKTPPDTPNRKKIVRFADAMGLDLEDVRTIFLEDLPHIPKSAYSDLKSSVVEPRIIPRQESAPRLGGAGKTLIPMFAQPHCSEGFLDRLKREKVCLESASLSDMALRGTVRVMNLDFHKALYVRYTLNEWRSFFEVEANYVQGSNDGLSDRFAFTIYGGDILSVGERLIFCLRYHAGGRQFWDNNHGQNYFFQCIAENLQLQLPPSPLDSWIHFL